MIEFVKTFFPWLVFLSNILFVLCLIAYLGKRSWGKKLICWLGKHALALGFLVSLFAMAGSLSYSEIVGWEPCFLCWWQRIFIYPQVVLLGIALWKRDLAVWRYVIPLALIATAISLYHTNIQWGGFSLTPCPATGPSCDKVFSKEFGYITIPLMALSASIYLIGLSLANKFKIKNENSNA